MPFGFRAITLKGSGTTSNGCAGSCIVSTGIAEPFPTRKDGVHLQFSYKSWSSSNGAHPNFFLSFFFYIPDKTAKINLLFPTTTTSVAESTNVVSLFFLSTVFLTVPFFIAVPFTLFFCSLFLSFFFSCWRIYTDHVDGY